MRRKSSWSIDIFLDPGQGARGAGQPLYKIIRRGLQSGRIIALTNTLVGARELLRGLRRGWAFLQLSAALLCQQNL